ncbi:MraY family glycosyltransferase [Alphaproteobacteria bacterium]|nr:MraY family glycosyltransferase [Alphaproteobacteria bacterium]
MNRRPVTVLGMLLVTNAFNLIDGGDGVTGILAILAISVIFLIEILSLNINSNLLTLALIGSLIPFLSFNRIQSKNKIFLCDSDSLFGGFSISFLLLYATQVNKSISPPFALWILAIPIFDVYALMIFRFKNSRSLFKPFRSHLHHFLQRLGLNNIQVVLSILGLGSLFLLLGFFIDSHFRSLSFPIFLLLLFLYIWFRSYSKLLRYNS